MPGGIETPTCRQNGRDMSIIMRAQRKEEKADYPDASLQHEQSEMSE